MCLYLFAYHPFTPPRFHLVILRREWYMPNPDRNRKISTPRLPVIMIHRSMSFGQCMAGGNKEWHNRMSTVATPINSLRYWVKIPNDTYILGRLLLCFDLEIVFDIYKELRGVWKYFIYCIFNYIVYQYTGNEYT